MCNHLNILISSLSEKECIIYQEMSTSKKSQRSNFIFFLSNLADIYNKCTGIKAEINQILIIIQRSTIKPNTK